MKNILLTVLISFITLSCKKTVEKNKDTLIGIYSSVDANLFHKAFDSNHQEHWLKSTLVLKSDSTYIFETEEILSRGNWKVMKSGIKFICLINVEKFDGRDYNPTIASCKTEIPILLFHNDEIMYENRKDQFEFVTKYPEKKGRTAYSRFALLREKCKTQVTLSQEIISILLFNYVALEKLPINNLVKPFL